ncbi:hypothetical protein CROQUDRAFT_261071 [Cronartium quercuum f. sp. fusiforme G11]|uniref:Uncharacterized protein n=1 Tax=Cronartium quercuum f. sp. fusiforme G11 TaxID=708437 RepID=A0A9P6NPQ3_9BASI|nr:hypothetical protein CROQUDRAFT_261071 [Cronartium quercuum f. sp. fusiforme G11]
MAHKFIWLRLRLSFSRFMFLILLWGKISTSTPLDNQLGNWLPARALSNLQYLQPRRRQPSSGLSKTLYSRANSPVKTTGLTNVNISSTDNKNLAKGKQVATTPSTNSSVTPITACPGAPKGVMSVLPAALNLPSKAGILCMSPKNQTNPPKIIPQNVATGSGEILAKNCVCAFNLIQQSLFKQFGLPPGPKDINTNKPQNLTTYKWLNGDIFSATCGAPVIETIPQCDKKPIPSSGCAIVSKMTACGTVDTCTVKITAKGELDLM